MSVISGFDNAGQMSLDKCHLYSCLLLRRDQENYPYSNSRDIADIEFVLVVVTGSGGGWWWFEK